MLRSGEKPQTCANGKWISSTIYRERERVGSLTFISDQANDDVRDIKARSGGADDSVGESNDAGTAAASLSPPPAPVTCAEDAASVFRGYRDSLQNKRLPLAVAFALAAPPKLKSQLWDSVQNMLCSSPRQNFIYPLLAVLPQFAPQDDAAALIDTTFQVTILITRERQNRDGPCCAIPTLATP